MEANSFKKAVAKFLRGLVYTYVRLSFRPKITYLDKRVLKNNREKPLIFVCNHTCLHDGQTALTILKPAVLFMAKDWMEKKYVSWVTAGGDFVGVDRFGLDTGWIRDAIDYIRDGKSVIIFPEGHVTKEGDPDKFKSGFTMLSVMTGAPVVPVYLDGNYHHFFGKRLRVVVGKVTELSPENKGLSAPYLEAESEKIRQKIMSFRNI